MNFEKASFNFLSKLIGRGNAAGVFLYAKEILQPSKFKQNHVPFQESVVTQQTDADGVTTVFHDGIPVQKYKVAPRSNSSSPVPDTVRINNPKNIIS
jgi:hypothetical protein